MIRYPIRQRQEFSLKADTDPSHIMPEEKAFALLLNHNKANISADRLPRYNKPQTCNPVNLS